MLLIRESGTAYINYETLNDNGKLRTHKYRQKWITIIQFEKKIKQIWCTLFWSSQCVHTLLLCYHRTLGSVPLSHYIVYQQFCGVYAIYHFIANDRNNVSHSKYILHTYTIYTFSTGSFQQHKKLFVMNMIAWWRGEEGVGRMVNKSNEVAPEPIQLKCSLQTNGIRAHVHIHAFKIY